MSKLYGYVRVSSDEQATSGLGLAAQKEKILQIAAVQELAGIEIIEEAGLSAKDIQGRPALKKILEEAGQTKNITLLVMKLDRLTRSVKDLQDILKIFSQGNNRLIASDMNIDTKSATGRLILGIITEVSQWEREVIGERTKSALAQLKKQGRRAGNIPYGYEKDKNWAEQKIIKGEIITYYPHLIKNEAEQNIIRQARELKSRRAHLREIAGTLNAIGYRTRTGGLWTPQGIYNIIKKEAEK